METLARIDEQDGKTTVHARVESLMSLISVVIPTFRRAEGVRRAVLSVLQQDYEGDLEIVVVDNAPEGGAEKALEGLEHERLRLVHEPRAGVATARNAGWAAAQGGMIAFLDDDESADSRWLAHLTAARSALDAPVIFGPIRTALPESARASAHAEYLEGFFARIGPAGDQLLNNYYGCGNSLIDRNALGLTAPPFDSSADQLGGEDDLLFAALKRQGIAFGWACSAWVSEHVAEDRANLAYALSRAFAFGQGPSQACAARTPPDIAGVTFWMAAGAFQASVFGVAAAALWAVRSRRRARYMDRAVQGLGKLFWMDVFAPRLYGGA